MTAAVSELQSTPLTRPSVTADAACQTSSTSADDDFTLIRRVATRDRQAFEVLYHRYARRLYSYLSKFLRQPESVEEVLDDVMFVVWQNANRFDYTSQLSTWIFGIAYYKALKALARAPREQSGMPPDTPRYSHQDDPEELITRREIGHTIARALRALSPQQRAVVELTFYDECSYGEIAAITKCPVNTVKTRMFHARRRLAPLLAKLGLCCTTEGQASPGRFPHLDRGAGPHPHDRSETALRLHVR
jgi:RNA polymerase sigma factor (sigma-70 family)